MLHCMYWVVGSLMGIEYAFAVSGEVWEDSMNYHADYGSVPDWADVYRLAGVYAPH